MPRNGSGQYDLPYDWNDDKINGIKVLASRMQAQDEDIGTALTNSLSKDGQTPLTGDLDFNNNKAVDLADGSDLQDAINVSQTQTGELQFYGVSTTTPAGTNGEDYDIAPFATILAYPAYVRFSFICHFTSIANPNARLNALAPKNLVKSNGVSGYTALQAGDMVADKEYIAVYNEDISTTEIIIENPELKNLDADNLAVKGKFSTTQGTTQTIASGIITAPSSNFLIETEASAATDDLDTINGGVDGMELTVGNVADARNVILKHNTGNIFNPAGFDIVLETTKDKVVLKYSSTLSLWIVTSSKSLAPIAIFEDQKASGTDGGTFTAGAWQTRTLNTTVTNRIAGVSLGSNQITLPAGSYRIFITSVGDDVQLHKVKLRNITDSTDPLIGFSSDTTTGSAVATNAICNGPLTITDTKVFEVQHRSSATQATYGFGSAASFGVVEVYCQIIIEKIA
jgi:hypothetical protein